MDRVRVRLAIERLVAAHFLAYPVAVAWAIACMPIAIWIDRDAALAMEHDLPRVGQLIVREVAPAAILAFALTHVAALPWAFETTAGRGRRVFWIACGALGAAAAVVAVAGWVWIFTR